MAEQVALGFGDLVRQLRAEAGLTQEELAEAASLSPRSVSDLERGIHRTARQDTAELLAGALGLDGPARPLFVAAARGRAPAEEVLAALREAAASEGPAPGPYLGLVPFEERDARLFYGRDELADQLAGRLDGAGILLVTGESGSGKSSLLRAGLLPRLAAGALGPGSQRWPRRVIRPAASPLRELAMALAEMAGADPVSVYRSLRTEPGEAPMLAGQAARTAAGRGADPGPGGPVGAAVGAPRLVLVVDQFEELFTAAGDGDAGRAEREAFIAALHAAATVPAGPAGIPAALVVVVVRVDYLGRLIGYPPLKAALDAGPFTVGPMSEAELRLAVTGPAAEAGLVVEPAVVEAVIAELRDEAGGGLGSGVLPLMSQAMAATWEHREGNELTLRGYRRAGGVADAVNRGAQAAYDALTGGQQDAARLVFTQLTVITPDGRLARRRCRRADLSAAGPQLAADVDAVIGVFSARRLLVLGQDSIEIAHDALLQAWKRLRDWLGDDQLDRALYGQVVTDAAAWQDHGRDPAYLYRPGRLATIDAAAARWQRAPARFPPLPVAGAAFLGAAHHAARRATRRRRSVIAGLLALTVIAVSAAGLAARDAANASRQAASAARQHAIALSRQLAAESLNIDGTQPVIARQLAVAAWAVFPTSQAASAITALLAEQQQQGMLPAAAPVQICAGCPNGGVFGVAFSPDGKLLASGSGDGTVRLWNLATGRLAGAPLRASTRPWVVAVAFSPDGKLLATAGGDGTVRLWNPATGRPARAPIQAAQTIVVAVAFSPDGKLLATAGGDGTVRLWDPVTGRPAGAPIKADVGPNGGLNGVAFSPDGTLLASSDVDGRVRLWNLTTGRPIGAPLRTGTGPYGGVFEVAFSPDGTLLAGAGGDGTVLLWNPATGRPAGAPLRTGSGLLGVTGVAFSPDGTLLASADGDGTVRLWDPVTRRLVGAPIQATSTLNGVNGVTFSPDGTLLAIGGGDGTVRLWNPATGQPADAFLRASAQNGVSAVAFSPDGTLLASGGGDGTVRLWNPITRRLVGTPLPASTQNGVSAVAFSPDSKLLASADGDGTVRLWDPVTGRLARAPLPASAQNGVSAVAFSPDGTLLASGGGDGTVGLWNPATGRPARAPIQATSAQNGVSAVAFSPDGKLLASADSDGTVGLWNPATGRPARAPLQTSTSPNIGVHWMAFSPDGKLLAIGGGDGTVRLWNPATGQPVGGPRHATSNARYGVHGVAFSPDGTLLATGDGDGTVRLWDPVTGRPVGAPIPAGAQTDVSAVAFSPDGTLLASAGADGTVRLWQVSLFTHPYAALCAYVGPPTPQEWNQYASGEPQPKVCS